jgi:hypothetical protein
MADDWRSPLVWSEKSDGSFETDIPDSLGQLRVRRVENLYFEIEATIVSYQRREWRVLTDRTEGDSGFEDFDRAKEFTQVDMDLAAVLFCEPGNHADLRGLLGGGPSPAKPVSDIFKLAGRGKFPGISQFIRELTGFWVSWPTPAIAQASERSGESEPNGANSLSFGSGNNRGWWEISLLTTLLG